MAHITQMAISLSSKVMVLGNMNESLDLVFLKILDVLGPSSTTKCVRVYPATSESPMLWKPKRIAPDPAIDDEIAVKLFAAWKECEDISKSKRRGLPEHSVYTHVLKNLDNKKMPPLMRFYISGVNKKNKVDMRAELRTFIKRLKTPGIENIKDEDI